MKINIKASDLTIEKEQLESKLSMLVKKPLLSLAKKPETWLPFIYEVDFFGKERGLLAIGQTKEGEKIFSKERVKGKGKDEKGNVVKIDKKNVAYGRVRMNQAGVYEFLIEGGIMKMAQAKKVIKSIGIIKKVIGNNFTIINAMPVEVENAQPEQATKDEQQAQDQQQDKSITQSPQYQKIQENLPKLQNAVGVVEEAKVQASIAKYEKVLAALIKEAKADNVITKEEQAEIDEVEQKLAEMKAHLKRLNGRKIKLTPKNRAKVATRIDVIHKRVQQMIKMREASRQA